MARPKPPTRRELLRAVAYGAVLFPDAADAAGATAVTYRIAVRPARALLGQRIVAVLGGTATRAVKDALTFDDPSLTLSFARRAAATEPQLWFPNRQVVQQGDRVIRTSTASTVVHLARGANLHRELDLTSLYPSAVLDIGDFELSCALGADDSPSRARPAPLTITSGPAAVANLLRLLEHARADVRARAASLLHRMTAHTTGYAANADAAERIDAADRWRAWWTATGRRLPWDDAAAGATFAGASGGTPSAQRPGRSQSLGGVAYTRKALDAREEQALASALDAWLRAPAAAAALKGRVRVADGVITYPPDGVVLAPSGDTLAKLAKALTALAERAGTSTPDASGAGIVLATVAQMPNAALLEPLAALQRATAERPAWHATQSVAEGLLDGFDPARTPVGPQ